MLLEIQYPIIPVSLKERQTLGIQCFVFVQFSQHVCIKLTNFVPVIKLVRTKLTIIQAKFFPQFRIKKVFE